MKIITAILIITGVIVFGCTHPDEITVSGKISSVIIPSILDEKFEATPQVVVTKPQTILLVELFLENHSTDWKTTWHTSIAPHEYVVINLANGDSFSFGYASNVLIKYTEDDYRYKQVNQDEIERFKSLLKTIKTSSNQNLDPIVTTPVDKVGAQSTQGHV